MKSFNLSSLMALFFLTQTFGLAFGQTVDISAADLKAASAQREEELNQELENPNINKKEKLLKELESLQTQTDLEFEAVLANMNEKINTYAVQRKKECLGEYLTIEITDDGEKKTLQNKLSKEEKKLCLLELIKLRKIFTRSLFEVRKKLLLQQHENQIKNLEQLQKTALKELDAMASKLK